MAQAAGNECDTNEEGVLYAKGRILQEKSNPAKISIPDPRRGDPLPHTLEVHERVGSALKRKVARRWRC